MSNERKQRDKLIIDRYIKDKCNEYDFHVPLEIISIIFTFYFVKIFNIEHGKDIKVKDNTIINIGNGSNASMNTTVIHQCMDADLDLDSRHIHTIKVKIIKQTELIGIGIVQKNYELDSAIFCNKMYFFSNQGAFYEGYSFQGTAPKYST